MFNRSCNGLMQNQNAAVVSSEVHNLYSGTMNMVTYVFCCVKLLLGFTFIAYESFN